jgi:hypothetical protein
MAELVTLQEFHIRSPAGTDTAHDQAFLSAAQAAVRSYLRWDPARTERTTYHDGTGTSELLFFHGRPVNLAVSEVRLDPQGGYGLVPDSFGPGTVLTPGIHYVFDSTVGILRMWRNPAGPWWGIFGVAQVGPSNYWGGLAASGARPAFWPRIPGSVQVTHISGYALDEVPEDLKQAVCLLAVRLRLLARTTLLTTSESWNGYSVGYAIPPLTGDALRLLGGDVLITSLLRPYREVVVAAGVR